MKCTRSMDGVYVSETVVQEIETHVRHDLRT